MDWLRRNWPDLLIGLALVAVIAGIIATLISGGSFFPAGNRTAENPDPGTTPLAGPATPGAQPDQASDAANGAATDLDAPGADVAGAGQPESASSLTATPASNASTDDPTAAEAGAAGADDAAAAGNAVANAAADGGALPVAVLPPGQTAADEGQAAGSAAGPASASSQTEAGNASSVTSSAGASADSGIDVEAAAGPEAPYRVSVGAYGNRDNAERQAATFEAAGYPVFIGTQGALNIVLVGPYDTESEARTVAARIRSADMGVADPTVYEFTGETDDQSTPSPVAAPAAAATESALASEETVITSSPSSASGVRYLQAGAYGTRDSSVPQRERLEGLGFVVTERVENDLVKLLIGPFDAVNLQNAQGRLEAAGIASFPR